MKLIKPTLLVDPKKSKYNLHLILQKARTHQLAFRPHFKTHQSRKISDWFWFEGVRKITVSSLDMAEYFASYGWQDILIAFPVNINEIEKINKLAGQIKLSVLVENRESVAFLNRHLEHEIDVLIKIDSGHRRTGIHWEATNEIVELAKEILQASMMQFKGILTHAGHTYNANSTTEIVHIHNQTKKHLILLKKELSKLANHLIISIGDTPGISLAKDFEGIDEIRPGNFIFYDLQQYKLGVCHLKDIAVCLACPVVSKHEARNEVVVYGGAVHFSKDIINEGGQPAYGYGVSLNNKSWLYESNPMVMRRLSQEHGILSVTPAQLNNLQIGDFVGILPVHSCLTANLMGSYMDTEGNLYDHMTKNTYCL